MASATAASPPPCGASTPAADGGSTPAPSRSATGTAGSPGTCQADGLSFALQGFPGVDLVGAARGQQGYTWSLERSSAKYSRVTLQPGGRAHFNLMYLPAASGDSAGIAVAKIVLTPPNTFTHWEVTWNQTVLLQDGATHPVTYIGPVVAGA